ncbi:MAG: hypothetical protein C5B55_07450 [Blastocatellia bacterium]|nr:MAG: hypothetical protein C5B55_07450 [Blastocatellia bacterium]
MADEQLARLESFRALIKAAERGAPIPPVNPDDLRRLHDTHAAISRRYPGKDGVVTVDSIARVCSSGANLPAVWLRYTRLRLLINEGILTEWQRSTGLDDTVYEMAATIPMKGFQLDQEAFLRLLRYEAVA